MPSLRPIIAAHKQKEKKIIVGMATRLQINLVNYSEIANFFFLLDMRNFDLFFRV